MDGAAKNAQKVAQRILPDRPHHLSLSFDRRYPESEGWWFTGASAPLQYMTYISAAQRGILTTRASFEICEELPPPMPTKVPAKGEAKKKLSLMDYQNRKKSASPVENGVPTKTDAKANGTVHAKPLPPKNDIKKEDVKVVVEKSKAPRQADARLEKPRPEMNGERYVEQTDRLWHASQSTDMRPSRSKTSSQMSSRPDTESRKRAADPDGNPSPQKRPRAEVITAKSDQSRQLKPGTPREGREGTTDRPSRDTRTETLYPTANGLPPSSSYRDRENTSSPRSTIQVNGSRPRSDSGTSTPRKPEILTKSALPQLLSPLHPSLFEGETRKEVIPKKQAGRVSKPEKEKAKKQLKIPALLSPTLPPIVEEFLALKDRTQQASKGVSSQASNPSSDSSSGARKTIVAAPPGRAVEEDEKSTRPSKIVTLKFKKKAIAKRVKDLLSLPSKSAKDALRKERSMSVEAAPPPAKKRPRLADDAPQEATASKRAKATADAITAKPAGPTTPLKHAATAMSRVTSSQSQGQGNTPAATTGLTPGTSDNRPPTRSEPLDPKALAQAESFKERHAEYQRLGSKLKHARDDLYRERGTNMTAADDRRATALHFEMVLAYMVAFHSLNQARMLERKVYEISAWETLLPHLTELRGRVAGNRALKALAVQMHVLCLEQITNAFATLDSGAAANSFNRWTKHHRNRALMWAEANAMWDRVEDPRMRTAIGPWTMVDDAVGAALTVMRRWAEKDGVKWVPEVTVKSERDRDRERDRGRDRERERPRPSLNGSRY
ncbi:hypothetical protein C8A00DRAFT_13719 [Chaetomidium leptoderma]|uniref:Uncharacterized protein n=1 Tax=Chaetomidium leptoderma TaxID=669021 RepID=A0AAN6ZY65_9PEZI|nr:hypothetical protein C8A00DRAFT_13719 [Chaetomidium leptoderma]